MHFCRGIVVYYESFKIEHTICAMHTYTFWYGQAYAHISMLRMTEKHSAYRHQIIIYQLKMRTLVFAFHHKLRYQIGHIICVWGHGVTSLWPYAARSDMDMHALRCTCVL